MASIAKTPVIKIIRQLMSEIRKSSSEKKIKDSLPVQFILSECRKNKTTDLQVCKAQEEAKFLAHTYQCYLQSIRNYIEINVKYTGKGERTIQETAKMVGFKLPHDPKKSMSYLDLASETALRREKNVPMLVKNQVGWRRLMLGMQPGPLMEAREENVMF